MSTPTRVAPLRLAGTLLVAAALVAGPSASALAEPSTDPTPTTSATAPASVTPSPTGSAEPTTSPSPTADPAPTSSDLAPSPSTSATATPSARPSPGAAQERLTGASAARLADTAGAAAPQAAYAADFVARTLAAGGDHYVYPDSGGFFDGGNTIDGILALAASGTGRTQMAESLAYLATHLGGYTGVDFGDRYVGGTAKTLIGVVAAGGDPRSFAGTDLVADLQGLEVAGGRFSDTGSGDYTITITQALALIALARAGEPLTAASVDTLVDQQCSDGGFRAGIDDPDGCVSDPDATAFAVQALVAAGATSAADEALDRLAAVQGADGSVRGADGTPNANTTGVAAQAFAAGGRDADLAEAQAFLTSLQYGCSSPAALRGGLAFSASARSTTAIDDSDLRATPQGTLGLTGESLLSARVAEGASAATTALSCPTTPTPTTTPAVAPTQDSGGSGDTGDTGEDLASDLPGSSAQTGSSARTGSLAQTGSDLLLPVGAGLALVLLGALAVAASRRRGAHA